MMSEPRPWTDWLKLLLGLLISAAAVGLVFHLVDPAAVAAAFRTVDFVRLAPILILVVVSYAARAASWWTLLPEGIGYPRTFLIMNAGYLINTVFPFRMGELGRAALLGSSENDFWEILPTIMLERFFDLVFALGLFFSALPFVLGFEYNLGFVLLLAALILTSFFCLVFLNRRQDRITAWFISGEGPKRIKGFLADKVSAFLAGLDVLSEPHRFLRAGGWMALSWGLALFYQYWLMDAVLGQARPLWVGFSLGAVALGAAVPSSPGNLGVYEASLLGALLVFGIDRSRALTYAVLSHGLNLGVTLIFGSLAFLREGFRLRTLWEVRKKTAPSSKEG